VLSLIVYRSIPFYLFFLFVFGGFSFLIFSLYFPFFFFFFLFFDSFLHTPQKFRPILFWLFKFSCKDDGGWKFRFQIDSIARKVPGSLGSLCLPVVTFSLCILVFQPELEGRQPSSCCCSWYSISIFPSLFFPPLLLLMPWYYYLPSFLLHLFKKVNHNCFDNKIWE
jgi:hypothetical protein